MTIWTPDKETNGVARYIALANQIDAAIENGDLNPGEKLPTHRHLADFLGVTVGTVTRGYAEAERRGLIHAIVGSGTFVRSPRQPEVLFTHNEQGFDSSDCDLSLNVPLANKAAPGLGPIMAEVGQNQDYMAELMRYQNVDGLSRHRLWLSSWLSEKGIQCKSENLTITCGGQHGVLLALTVVTRPGDTIAAEGLTYPGLKSAAGQRGVKTIGLAMDEKGVLPDEFENQCKLNNIRAIYLCPSIQNPTNASMDNERRNQILEIASKFDVWIIEDEIPTNYSDQNPHSFINLAPERTFHINSHSKTIAPGLRVGYLISPPKFKDSVSAAIRAQCWFAPTLNVEIVQRFLDRHESKTWISAQKKELDHRHKLFMSILGGFNIKLIQGSYHAWLVLPEPWRAHEFQSHLLASGVRVLSSESFAVGRFSAPQAIRISLSGPETIGKLEKGLTIIKKRLDDGYDSHLSVL